MEIHIKKATQRKKDLLAIGGKLNMLVKCV
jgi:hypothetical protein